MRSRFAQQQHLARSKGEDECYAKLDKSLGTISIMGEINPKVASDFRQHLRTLERLQRHKSIVVEINSPGGDIEAGFAIIDSIELCTKPVTTRVAGIAFSMGSLILAAGHQREALPSSTVMVHQGTYRFYCTADELDTQTDECKRIEKLCNDYLDRRTEQPSGYWAARHNGKDLFLTADMCLTEKLIHQILKRKG